MILSLAAPYPIYADTATPAPPASAAEAGSGNSVGPDGIPDTLRWLNEMARRFNIFTNAGRLIRDEFDIDLIVGDPFTLREDTIAALNRIPDRVRLGLVNFVLTNPEQTMGQPDPGNDMGSTSPAARGISYILPDQMNSTLLQTLNNNIFNNTLSSEQMIDLGVYLLSKTPFFPKTKEGWNKLKNRLYQYDIYLAIMVVSIMALFNKGSLAFTGYLFDGPGGTRIGWYTSASKLGLSLSPEAKAGLELKHPNFTVLAGGIKNFDWTQRTRLEAEVITNIFGKLVQKLGWDMAGSVRVEYTTNDNDVTQQKTGTVTANMYARKGKVFFDNAPYTISILASSGVTTIGKPTEQGTVSFDNEHSGFLISFSTGFGPQNYGPDSPLNGRFAWTGGTMAGYRFEAGIHKIIVQLLNEARSVRTDLEDIEKAKQRLEQILKANPDPKSPEVQKAEVWLGLARVHVAEHFVNYRKLLATYTEVRYGTDPQLKPLDDETFKKASLEANESTYGAEIHTLNFSLLNQN